MPTPPDPAKSAARAPAPASGPPAPPRFHPASAYRGGTFQFNYGARPSLRQVRREDQAPRPNIPGATHEMLVGVAGAVTEKWEKPAGWLLTGFAAVVALMVSNYDKATGVLGTASVHWVVVLFFLAAVAHAVQQIFSTIVQAAVAGGKIGRELKLQPINEAELRQLFDGMVAAYPWPMKGFLRRKYDQMLAHGLAPLSKSIGRMVATVLWSAVAQMVFGLIAIGVVTWAVTRITWLAPTPAGAGASVEAPATPPAPPAAGPGSPN